jgi:hypothetical protein
VISAAKTCGKNEALSVPENKKMRSAGLFEWISGNQPPDGHEYAHGWWNSIKFLQLLSTDFEDFEFDVITSFPMETPPPSSTITMPVVWARRPNLEIIWKESWVVEPYFAVTVKWGFPSPIILLNILEPIDQQNKWLLRDFPDDCLFEFYREGASAFSGSVKNQHLLYALFHILNSQVKAHG